MTHRMIMHPPLDTHVFLYLIQFISPTVPRSIVKQHLLQSKNYTVLHYSWTKLCKPNRGDKGEKWKGLIFLTKNYILYVTLNSSSFG